MAITSASTDNNDTIPLQRCPGLYIKTDTPKGRGVFTSERITAGTIIDICSVLILDPVENTTHIEKTGMYHYTYNWPLRDQSANQTGKTQAVIFGLGSMFNHSSLDQNVGWKRDVDRQIIVYRALRDIRPGEELCISYGYRLTFVDADGFATGSESIEDEDEHLGRIELETGT